MVPDLIGLQEQDDLDSFDPSDTGYMDRYSDDDEPSLRTRDVSKRAPKVTRMRGDVDAVVRSCLGHYLHPRN